MDVTAMHVIKALKFGKVPHVGTRRLCVAREPEIAEFGNVLKYIAGGGFDSRYLRGDYGSGKTFMCSIVRELAFEAGMVVSIVNLNREVPFGRRDLVLAEVLRGLRTVNSGSSCAMGEILERWFYKYDPSTPVEVNKELAEAIARVSSSDPGMAMGLRAYHRAMIDGNDILMQGVVDWLRGESIERDVRAAIKVVGKVSAEGAFRRLRAFCALMRDAGYPGIVILIDEIEAVQRLSKPQRDAAYGSMREIIDVGPVEFPYTLFLFAGTPPFFEDEFKGCASYQPLWQRVRPQQVYSQRDLRQPIIRLEEFDGDALRMVSEKVRELHALAYDWDARERFPETSVRALIAAAGTKFGEVKQRPRAFLKALVDALDARQQGLDVDLNAIVDEAKDTDTLSAAALDDDVIEAAV
ncbi:MAG TPA: BREX system ATP-binding domain-containing protein [Candidatus Tumulicola sp.]|jgi:adenosylhomocysteinase